MPLCYCGSKQPFADCCRPLIQGQRHPDSPEALMRSRYSAFANHDYDYICQTQSEAISRDELATSCAHTQWLRLQVHQSSMDNHRGKVHFSAWYMDEAGMGVLSETSDFALVAGQWCYTGGTIAPHSGPVKIKPNAPCPCASGKKAKKCCLKR